ncbi:hypothetical protein [Nocardia mexicana]|nr:hypothetical protein [Nocardia mexicana]
MGAVEDSDWMANVSPEERAAWVRQDRLMYGGLIAIGTVVIQPFLTSGPLDLTAMIAVISFAIGLPHLAVMVLIEDWPAPDIYPKLSWMPTMAKSLGLSGSTAGVVAAFWHISWIAGVAVLASGIGAGSALTVYQAKVMVPEEERRQVEAVRQQAERQAEAEREQSRRQAEAFQRQAGEARRHRGKSTDDTGRS